MKKFFSNKTVKLSLLSSFIYLVIAVVFTWPLLTHFFSFIPGTDEDSATHVWYLWWFRWALIEGHSPLFKTDWIFHPQVIDRIFDVHTFVNATISLPFQYLFGLVASSNLLFYLNFVLTGLGMWFLVYRLTKNPFSAFLSGLIVVFMPYTWGQMLDNHTNLYTIWFIPLYLLFLLKTLEEKSLKNPFFAGILFGLQALNDLTLTTFMILATVLIGFYYLIFYPGTIRNENFSINFFTIKRLLFLGLVFVIIFLPILVPVYEAIRNGNDPGAPLGVQQVWSAQPQNFLYPSGNNPILKGFSKIQNVNAIEGSIYLGLTTLALALIGSFSFLVTKRKFSKEIGLWLILFFSFAALSLGPCATYLGIKTNLSFCSGLPLPFLFFHKLPFIGGIQEPIRMHLYTMISLAVLGGFGFKFLADKFTKKIAGVIVVVLSLFILLEYYTSIPFTDLTPPTIYATIANDKGDFSVLDLPVGWNNQSINTGFSPIGSLQYFQSAYQHKSFRATVARVPNESIQYYLDKPLFKYLINPKSPPDKDDIDKNKVRQVFQDFHIKYIVYHKNYYGVKGRNSGDSLRLIREVLGAEQIQEDDKTITFKLTF